MKLVSVIIPTLNEAGTIGNLLDILEDQTFQGESEVIVVDGGSTDGTVKIVSAREAVRLIETSPGVSAQRNAGAAIASGDFLIFLDADTSPEPNFLRRIVASYQNKTFAVACPWFVPSTWRPDIQLIYLVFNCLFWLSQLRYHTGAGVCIVTPKETFAKVGGFEDTLHLGEDVRYLQSASEFGPHRHLLLPLKTSPRRFEREGVLKTLLFYVRISKALLCCNQENLKALSYPPIRSETNP
jgi:glycosyltransferase involved in cell wall biosynthesis